MSTPDKPRIEYVPPSDEVLNRLARDACAQLALAHGSAYQDPDVIHGLAELLRIAARIEARRLNQAASVDTISD
jgi:hypothetical protein